MYLRFTTIAKKDQKLEAQNFHWLKNYAAIWATEKYKLFLIITVNKNVDRIMHFENSLIFAIFVACAINIYIGSVINMLLHWVQYF